MLHHEECREQVTLRLPSELKEALHTEAQQKGVSFDGLICLILRAKVREFRREGLQNP